MITIKIDEILSSLDKVKKQGAGYIACCPAHDDNNPSLSIKEEDGKILLYCHAGCEINDICNALDIKVSDLFTQTAKSHTDKHLVETYNYKDCNGKVVYQKLRYEPKTFVVRRPTVDGWLYNLQGISPMLYNLPKVVRSNEIFIVEGEKDVNNLVSMGFVATSPPSGAGKWDESFNKYFQNKNVYIIPDNDDIGREHAENVAKNILTVSNRVKILDLKVGYRHLKEKGDVSDILDALGKDKTVEMLKNLVDTAPYETMVTLSDNEWPEIKPFDIFDLPPFPMDSLPKTMREYVKTVSDNLATPIEMGALATLAIVAVTVQGKVFIQAKDDYKESTNLYVLIIAEPGERKSPLLKLLSAPLYEHERKINKERKQRIYEEEAKIKALRQRLSEYEDNGKFAESVSLQQEIDELEKNKTHLTRLTSDDFTVEALTSLMAENDGRIAVISSEGGMFNNITGRYSNKGSFESLLKAYTGDTIRIDRKSRGPELIDSALLTILLMAQESVLEGIMSNADLRGQGFLGRFLYCKPKSPMGTRSYDTPHLNHELISDFNAMLSKFLDIDEVVTLTFSDEAQKVCKDFFDWIEPRLVGEFEDIKDWASKLHGTTIRIAGILHLIENNGVENSVISKSTMENARDIAIYFIEHAKMAFSLMGTSESVVKAKFILHKLESANVTEITKRDLYLLCRSRFFKKADDINEALCLLVEHGYIKIKNNTKSHTVGRKPSTVYKLNSVHFEHFVQKNKNI